MILSCGTILYFNFFKKEQFDLFLNKARSSIESIHNRLVTVFSPVVITGPTYHDSIIHNHYQSTLTNQEIVSHNDWYLDASYADDECYDLSSLCLSPPSSLGASTMAKFDYLLDQVEQIKQNIAEPSPLVNCRQLSPSQPTTSRGLVRRSASELTLASLEWDVGDLPMSNDGYYFTSEDRTHLSVRKKEIFLKDIKYNDIIDAEMLAQVLFNHDFDIEEDRIFKVKKQYTCMKHQLKYLSKTYYTKLSQCRSNRDSAYFEEEI